MNKTSTAKIYLWKIMKLGFVQIAIAMMMSGVALSHDNYGQILDKKISLEVTDHSLKNILKEISLASQVEISYSDELVDFTDRISYTASALPLRDVLNQLLLPHGITFTVHESLSLITLQALDPSEDILPDISSVDKKSGTIITGKVIDQSSNLPIAGVNVLVKGTTSGTNTDQNGVYNINAEDVDILVFSFIGYQTFETKIEGRSVIDIALAIDVKNLQEVIVNAGYWDVTQQQQTGNIARVTAKEIQTQPVSNPLSALEGRMPGVYVNEASGIAGAGISIQIRGQNSLRNTFANNGNLPFYIVDGVPFTSTPMTSDFLNIQGGNPLISLDPSSIESIEILKDADATAIYGSRGANGVVLITTKKGQAGKTKIDLTFSQGVGKVTRMMDLLHTEDYLMMRNEAFANDKATPGVTDYDVNGTWSTARYTDWQKELIGGTASQTNAQLSISGGNVSTQYLIGGSFFNQSTVFPGGTAFRRGAARVEVSNTSQDKKFFVNFSSSYTVNDNNLNTDFTSMATTLAPNAPALYDENGNLNWENSTWNNPLANLEKKYNSNTSNLITNVSLRYTIVPGLNIKSNFGYTALSVDETQTNPISRFNPIVQPTQTGSALYAFGKGKTWIIEPQLEYKKKIARGIFTALIGSTFQDSKVDRETLSATGFTSDALLNNIRSATSISVSQYDYSQYRYNAFFSRVNYIWNEKYILNLTGRRDGSSRFGPGNRTATFGAVGAAWIFSNESFLKNSLPVMSFGKLRTSFGSSGSDAIGNYQYLNSFSSTSYPYNGVSGLQVTRMQNPDYSWESNVKFESAMDLGFFNDRLNVSTAFYMNHSSNQLVGNPLPLMTGQSSVQYNLAAVVENRGWEFEVRTVNIKLDAFRWTTSANLTIPRNTLLEFPNIQSFPAYNSKYDIGRSIYILKYYESAGVDPTTGLYNLTDQNGDNVITGADIIGLKKIAQQAYGGLSNAFTFKGLQLDVFFQFTKQTGSSYARNYQAPGRFTNQPTDVLDRWRKAGDIVPIQRFAVSSAGSSAYSNFQQSDGIVVDASFIRLKNVSLSYTIPASALSKLHLASTRIFMTGQNLMTFTKYKGMDPETPSSSTLPPLKIFTLGAQFTF